jgi:sugar phosphate isomerase/epimerase
VGRGADEVKYAVSNWIYGDEPLQVTLERLARYGYQGVELQGDLDRYDPREVRALAERYGVTVCSVAAMFPWPGDRDLSHPDPWVRAHAVGYARRLVEFAVSVGAPQVLLVPTAVPRRAPVEYAGDPETWWPLVEHEWSLGVASVREVAGFAAERGVRLTVEPVNRYESFLLNTAEEALRFVEEVDSPWLGVHLDTFHMNLEERDPAAAVRRAGSRLTSLHLSDSHRGPVGEGHLDLKAILRSLREISFDGWLILEPLPPVPDLTVAIRSRWAASLRDLYAERSLRWLQALEARLEAENEERPEVRR